jgi:hypothetical protein
MASYPNRNLLRGIRACIVIALIAVTGVEAVVNNQTTNEQYEHSEKMAKTKLTKPECGMKVFVSYTDKKKCNALLVPAVITGVNTMHDGSVEINVRYLDGSTIHSRVALEDVFERDDTVSYENWTLHDYDPSTTDAEGQTPVTTGSSSRPVVSGPTMGAASGGGGANVHGAGKKRKLTDAETGKQPMAQNMDDALHDDLDVGAALDELDVVIESRMAAAEARATAAEARAAAAEARTAAAEARTAALQQEMETAEVYNHNTCHDYKGMGSGK